MYRLGKRWGIVQFGIVMTLLVVGLADCEDGKVQPEALDGSGTAIPHFTTGELPSVVIGQPDFVTNNTASTASEFDSPYGNVTVAGGVLFIADQNNNRITGYNAIPTTNGASADFVLGQTNFTNSAGGTSAVLLANPWAVSSANGKLAVTDSTNYRVLIWNSIPTAFAVPADVVVGQTAMTGNTMACSQTGMFLPTGISIGGGRLVVADQNNHRVLIWNAIPTANGQPANLALGQPTFTSCLGNITGVSTPAANTLRSPDGVWTDGNRVIVSDLQNSRVLIWNTFPTVMDQPADLVIGQTNFTSFTPGTGATGMNSPAGVDSNGTQLVVTDLANRILFYNKIPTVNGQSVDAVLGQPDLTSTTTDNGGLADGLDTPRGVFLAGTLLFVSDGNNSRVLIYQ